MMINLLSSRYYELKLNKFDWTLDNNRIEEIQDFVNSMGLILNSIQAHLSIPCLKKDAVKL